MKKKVKILEISSVTHDVKRFVVERPKGYEFIPGQATEVSINKPGWRYEERPFTFTNLINAPHLEFIIKRYPQHKGVTEELHKLSLGDELIIRKPFGVMQYGGKGIFVAGGAGITPFIAILRMLEKEDALLGNKLIFSNKTRDDIILEEELKSMFGGDPDDLIFTLTQEKRADYEDKLVDEEFLKKHVDNFGKQKFYLCGPPRMVKQLTATLERLGANINSVTFEGK
ncbi:MAG: FAD-binding oxidoreductase [Candidatus Colwellbacteria bacterium]|nr:FAD-binding oxidoreductase [Candidatus Colwellbacteria bacterium]